MADSRFPILLTDIYTKSHPSFFLTSVEGGKSISNAFVGKKYEKSKRSFAMPEKVGNRLVPGPDYMVDVLKLPNLAARVSGESLQMCVTWRCVLMEDYTSSVGQFWPFLVNR
ncbi:hypothetical protein TNCV_3017441 [Trichonephila clavipes]|nr:hypothetical protein TNCV_3017441 [Trichonephila clavipes]